MSDEEPLDLGACCACGEAGPTVRNIVMLPKKSLVPGTGWGCVICHLPCDGASVVVCDACLETQRPFQEYIYDDAGKKLRRPIEELTEPFTHDDGLHAGEQPPALPALDMETLVDHAMSGWPDYVEGDPDEWDDPHDCTPVLEVFPDQPRLKAYLLAQGYLEIRSRHRRGGLAFTVLGKRGNLAWCGDPRCDRVIVEGPLSLFLDEGRAGEIALHWACFERLQAEGVLALQHPPAPEAEDAS